MKNILIVDDERNLCKLYKDELEEEIKDCQIFLALSGKEALLFIEKHPELDLVILDIKMKDTDGLEILKKLRIKATGLPIIINSAYGSYKSNFITWLADACLVKSSNLDELKNTVKEILFSD